MFKNPKIWIFLAAAVGLVFLFLAFFGGRGVDWSERYIKDKEMAKGTHFVAELLKHYDENRNFKELDSPIHESLNSIEAPTNYVFIGKEIYLPNEDLEVLLDYVYRGNNAFLFTRSLTSKLMQELEFEEDGHSDWFYESAYSNGVSQSLVNPDLSISQDSCFDYMRYGRSGRSWKFFSPLLLDSLEGEKLGASTMSTSLYRYNNTSYYMNTESDTVDTIINEINYFRISYGEGYFYFHSQPIIFCNASLTERTNLDYINGVFAYLNEGDILWEEHNWVFKRPFSKTYIPQSRFMQKDESILKMILENEELKWGWYTLLLMAILFVVFNGKRKQATIRLLPDYANTTLLQIKKMGFLYEDIGDYFDITQSMFENFLWFLHVKLNIDTHQESEKIIRDIVKSTDYDEETIRSIFGTYKKIENWKSVTHGVFIKLHDDIEKFYASLK